MPELITPDILGAYLRGQNAVVQQRAQAQQYALGQQALQQGEYALQEQPLRLEQLRLAMRQKQMQMDAANEYLQGSAQGAPPPNSPQAPQGAPMAGGQPQTAAGTMAGNGGNLLTDHLQRYQIASSIASGTNIFEIAKQQAEAQAAEQKNQIERTKLGLAPQVDLAKTIANDPQADRTVMSNPSLLQQWMQYAPRIGADPHDPKQMTPENVRRAAVLAHNDMVAQYGGEPLAMPNVEQTVTGPLGSIYQKDGLTGKMTQVKGEESLTDVIDPATGQPVKVRASAAEGKQPFNQSIFGAANMSDQALQFAADTYRTTGKFPTSMGRNPAMQAKVLEKVAADAAASGDTAGSIVARQAALKANGMALDQNSKLLTSTRGYAETLDKNIDSLLQVYKAGDSPLINRAFRAWQQGVTGDPNTAKIVVYLNAVQGEYAKLKSGSLGNAPASDAAMKDAKEVINKYMTQGGIEAVAAAMRQEKENRLGALQDENSRLTGALSANPGKTAPAGGAHPADITAILQKYGH